MYIIDSRPDTVIPENSRALVRDAHGALVAAAYGEHCDQTAQTIIVALSNTDPYSVIQQQDAELKQLRPVTERLDRLTKQLAESGETNRNLIRELIRLQGIISERNATIASLQAELAELRGRCAEAEALNGYVMEDAS